MDTLSIRTEPPEVRGSEASRECFACYEGVLYIGHIAQDEHGEELEVIERVPCLRCAKGKEV